MVGWKCECRGRRPNNDMQEGLLRPPSSLCLEIDRCPELVCVCVCVCVRRCNVACCFQFLFSHHIDGERWRWSGYQDTWTLAHTRTYTRAHTYIHAHTRAHKHVCPVQDSLCTVQGRTYASVCTPLYVCMYVCMCVFVCVHASEACRWVVCTPRGVKPHLQFQFWSLKKGLNYLCVGDAAPLHPFASAVSPCGHLSHSHGVWFWAGECRQHTSEPRTSVWSTRYVGAFPFQVVSFSQQVRPPPLGVKCKSLKQVFVHPVISERIPWEV